MVQTSRLTAAQNFIFTFSDAILGLYQEPREGYRRAGFVGLLAGVGKAVLYVTFMPVNALLVRSLSYLRSLVLSFEHVRTGNGRAHLHRHRAKREEAIRTRRHGSLRHTMSTGLRCGSRGDRRGEAYHPRCFQAAPDDNPGTPAG